MAIEFKRTQYAGDTPVFWRGEAKILPGGFKLLQTFPKGTRIRRGTPLYIVPGTLTANVVKHAVVIAGGTTTAPRVTKNSYFQAGDLVMDITGNIGRAITAIDTTNSEYDVLTFASALTGVAADAHLVEASAATASEPKFVPNMVTGETTEPLDGADQDTISAAYDCVVLLGYATKLPAAWLNAGVGLKSNPKIIYVKQ